MSDHCHLSETADLTDGARRMQGILVQRSIRESGSMVASRLAYWSAKALRVLDGTQHHCRVMRVFTHACKGEGRTYCMFMDNTVNAI